MTIFARLRLLLLCLILFGSATLGGSEEEKDTPLKSGLLVMAHGGDLHWNQAVENALEPLRGRLPMDIAYGMADPHSLQAAVKRLESRGVRRIAVVRLFVSASSFREQTEYFLGLREAPPARFLLHGGEPLPDEEEHYRSGVDPFSLVRVVDSSKEQIPPIQKEARVSLNQEGLYDSPEIGKIIVQRVAALSQRPSFESVLVLAHGEGDDRQDALWQQRISSLVEGIESLGAFREVRVQTLREDWFRKREQAMGKIREFFSHQQEENSNVIVVPFRVFGFGPYRAVLEGLDYTADGRGLIPHPSVTRWVEQQASHVFEQEGWPNPLQAEQGTSQ